MTSSSASLPVAHQTHAGLAPQLTQFQRQTGVSDVVLFGRDGICMAYGGGDQEPVDTQLQERAESAAASYALLLSLAEGVPRIWPGRERNGVETIMLRHSLHGVPWPVIVCRTHTGGLMAALPPSTTSSEAPDPTQLGYQLVRLVEQLRLHREWEQA